MKIEICEQMLQSWLLNCKQCEIVQTNWTISPLRIFSTNEINDVKRLMNSIQDELNNLLDNDSINALQESTDNDVLEEYSFETADLEQIVKAKKKTKVKKLNILKKNRPEQFIRQCEIDIVGSKFNNGIAERIYLIDTAFHTKGLGYHDAVATVLKKIIRAILVSAIVFGTNVPISIIFAAPFCRTNLSNEITKVVNNLRAITARDYPNITINLYFNETFTNEVYLPLNTEIKKLNNDNDLFMRALNLAHVAESFNSVVSASTGTAPNTPIHSVNNVKNNNQKVVFDILKNLINTGKMTTELLKNLQIPVYAKEKFKLPTYPVLLKESNFIFSAFEKCRFYKSTITINGDKYLVCSQWIPERIALLQDWHKTL